jgi:glycosyltransferase involved in cell wall biosynthesis
VDRTDIRLDVIVPTYNRAELLARLLESLLTAPVPSGLQVRITVVDNNCSDRTPEVVARYRVAFGERLRCIFEPQQGRSAALNAGISATDGDLLGFIDDDEEIDTAWYATVHARFTAGGVDYISGPYVPRWGAPIPDWLPKRFPAVIGWVDGGSTVRTFGEDYDGVPMGGNMVLKRPVVERVGAYRTDLGRVGSRRLESCEDHDYFDRLQRARARGEYLPQLIIYHYVPEARLSKRYFRRWCLWHGVSVGIMNRDRRQPVRYLAGIPRYMVGDAARGILRLLSRRDVRRPDEAFADELALWDLAGYLYGTWLHRGRRMPTPVPASRDLVTRRR